MFRSATFKLTMWYLAIVMAISVVFSFVIYHFASDALGLGLHNQTMRIYHEFPVFNNNPLLKPGKDMAAGDHQILLRLIYFNVLVLALAGIASYFLARRSLQPIEAAHERQKRFTADVSHELRTPLTSLKMTTEVALLDPKAPATELRQVLESTLEDTDKMERLINSLLRLTKLDSGQVQDNFLAVASQPIVRASIDHVQRSATSKDITIASDDHDAPLFGDAESLEQLVVIILDNAVKYSPAGSTIHIKTTKHEKTAEIVIQDEGEGISQEALPHVFDRFYRADTARQTTSESGFGLGLSIAKLIADMHHGTITITSRPGHGTTVKVVLPSLSFTK
jgi:two-component system sensor histidine kinase CiaH